MTIERRGPADDGGNGSGAAPPEPSHERTLSDYAKAAPQLAKLVYRLMTDTRIPPKSKAVLAGVAGYLLLPVDVMPDFIPLAGVADDLILVAWALDGLLNHVPDHIVRQHWEGDEDILELVREVLSAATGIMPARLKRALSMFGR